MDQIQIFLPAVDDDAISSSLRTLTRKLAEAKKAEAVGDWIGGPYGDGGGGADFENDVFEIHYDRQHPTCNCGGSMPKHKPDCDQVTKREEWFAAKMKAGIIPEDEQDGHGNLSFDRMDRWMRSHPFPSCSCGEDAAWRAAHPGVEPNDDGMESPHPSDFPHERSCDWSVVYRPNFLHKPSGSTVHWYKCIGRSMECELKAEWHVLIRECFDSIKAAS